MDSSFLHFGSIYRLLEAIGLTDPIHPPVAHVPIGLVVGAFLLGLVSLRVHSATVGRAANYCVLLAFIFVFVTAAFGYLDWQHFFAGGWLRPIKIKLVLAAILLILLSAAMITGRRSEETSGGRLVIYAGCLVVALGLGYFGGQLVYSGRSPSAPPPLQAGEALFRGNCSGCHPYGANIVDPDRPLRGAAELREFATFLRWIRDPRLPDGARGVMPPFPPSRITDEQAKILRQYIGTVMGHVNADDKGELDVPAVRVRVDPESITKGRALFQTSCISCHAANSTEAKIGPGLKGIMKRERLPVSGRLASPENVYHQLRRPYRNMPSFADRLSDDDVFNLIAYLNTR
jgi:mono/diheme cytochrome c family protein